MLMLMASNGTARTALRRRNTKRIDKAVMTIIMAAAAAIDPMTVQAQRIRTAAAAADPMHSVLGGQINADAAAGQAGRVICCGRGTVVDVPGGDD
jgi:hypothetical protein